MASNDFLEQVLPGIGQATKSATGVIGDMLNGLPSPSMARTTNAYWGAGAGQPAGGSSAGIESFIGQRGTDLYNQQAQQRQQQGLGNLFQAVNTYSAPYLQNQAQQQQASQFGQNLAQQGNQFGQNLALQKSAQEQAANQFGQNLGLQREQLGQQGTQFGQNLALQQAAQANQASQFGQNLGLQQQQLAQQNQQFNQSNEIARFQALLQALGLGGNLSVLR